VIVQTHCSRGEPVLASRPSLTTLAPNPSTRRRLTETAVTLWVSAVLAQYGVSRFIAPPELPLLDSRPVSWLARSSAGKNRKKFGWSDDINPWRTPCLNTSWSALGFAANVVGVRGRRGGGSRWIRTAVWGGVDAQTSQSPSRS